MSAKSTTVPRVMGPYGSSYLSVSSLRFSPRLRQKKTLPAGMGLPGARAKSAAGRRSAGHSRCSGCGRAVGGRERTGPHDKGDGGDEQRVADDRHALGHVGVFAPKRHQDLPWQGERVV